MMPLNCQVQIVTLQLDLLILLDWDEIDRSKVFPLATTKQDPVQVCLLVYEKRDVNEDVSHHCPGIRCSSCPHQTCGIPLHSQDSFHVYV